MDTFSFYFSLPVSQFLSAKKHWCQCLVYLSGGNQDIESNEGAWIVGERGRAFISVLGQGASCYPSSSMCSLLRAHSLSC